MASETKGNKVDISTFLSCFNVNFMSCVSREMHPEIIFYWFVATLVNVFYYFEKYEIFQFSWQTKFLPLTAFQEKSPPAASEKLSGNPPKMFK